MSTISASTTTTTAYKVTADTTGALVLQTGATPTTAVTIDTSQNVGIGTSSPTTTLDLNNGAGLNTSMAFSQAGSTKWYIGNVNSANAFRFYDNTAAAERMRIDSSGRLLVNTTTALGSAKLVVEADTTTANPMTVSNSRSSASTDYSVIFYRNASIVGSVQTSLSATSYVTSSDYRLKENIAPMTGALSKVAQLKPCTYNWKLDGEASQGFIAHELQEVVPECVTGEKDAVDADGNPKYQGIDTSFLVATLTAAIQEQQALITQLQADVATLKGAA